MGRKLALDVGKARVGVAMSDPSGIIASPSNALERQREDRDTVDQIRSLVLEHDIEAIFVGDPISLSGSETSSTRDSRDFASLLRLSIGVPVRMIDERLSTVSAARNLRDSGRNARSSKSMIDSASAVVILESVLRSERLSGEDAGMPVGDLYGS